MIQEGKYLYCITGNNHERNFGPIGIGGRGDEVITVSYNDLGAVISNAPIKKYPTTRENTITHEKVIEKVMGEEQTLLPVKFGTVAGSAQDVRDVLRKRYREFKDILREMDNKVELGVRALWLDMEKIFSEILEQREDIKRLRNKTAHRPTRESMIRVGELVKDALEKKKKKEANPIVNTLKRISTDFRLNNTFGDKMFLNAAFLVDRDQEKEFDNEVDTLRAKYEKRMKIIYVGPVPPFNFVNIVIHWEGG